MGQESRAEERVGAGDGAEWVVEQVPLGAGEQLLVGLIVAFSVMATLAIGWLAVRQLWADLPATARALDLLAEDFRGNWPLLLAVLGALWALAFAVNVALHECGHALGGQMVGFWFSALHLGPMAIRRTPRGLRFARSPHRLAGGCESYPVTGQDLRLREPVYVLLGPVTNLLLGWLGATAAHSSVAGGVAAITLPNAVGCLLATMVGQLGLVLFVGNVVPTRRDTRWNDGARLLALLRGGPALERQHLLLLLVGHQARGVPAREWPAALIEGLLARSKGTDSEFLVSVFGYTRALATGDIGAAGALLDRSIATFPKKTGPESTMASEIAYFEARYRGRSDRARMWLQRAGSDRWGAYMWPRALAAIHLAEGCYAEAAQVAAAGLEAHTQFRERDGRPHQLEGQNLAELLALAQAGVAAQAPAR
ncbi:MAG TPA: hypothetical protein VGS80_11770 [Ktedonobacterales bacterium]|nr:hypothetical protein [Ktedonobacterales bacterium]